MAREEAGSATQGARKDQRRERHAAQVLDSTQQVKAQAPGPFQSRIFPCKQR